MENGTRVSDIKKKFEKLNIKKAIKNDKSNNPLTSSDLIPPSLNSKNIIRRSNAFRTDKLGKSEESRRPCSSTSDTLFQNYSVRTVDSHANFLPKSYTISTVNNFQQKFDNPKPNRKVQTKPTNKRDIDKHVITVTGFSHPSSYLVTKKVSNSPPKSSSPSSRASTSSVYSVDTLKKVLSTPLPNGPPPRKPPRTFEYGFSESPPLKAKPFLKPTLSNESPVLPTQIPHRIVPYLQRSKTEPHITLNRNTENKKLNVTAGHVDIIKRQLNQNINKTPPNSFPHSILRNFNCISDRNSNIYDVPFIPNKRNTVIGQPPLGRHQNIVQRQTHSYYEPYSPRSNRKSYFNVNTHLDAMNLSNTSLPKENHNSLHYHSSPVRNSSDPTVESTILHPDNFEGNRIFLERILNDAFGESEPTVPKNPDSDTDSGSSYIDEPLSSVSAEKLIAERKGYLQRVVSLRNPAAPLQHATTMSLPPQTRVNNSFKLFESVLLISITPDQDRGCVPFIKATYYHDTNSSVPALLEDLCFPDASLWPPSPHTHNNYRVVMTNAEGDRKYAYCRRLQPEGTPFWIPLAYSIITQHNAPGFYYKILAEIEIRHGLPEIKFCQFIQALSECILPPPGVPLKIGRSVGDFNVMRPEDPRVEDKDLINLINYISIPIFLKLLSTILLERKAILIASNVSKLSECIEGLETALYPFVWQHTLITTVPKQMHDLCQAPTPYIVGLMRQNLDVFTFSDIGQMFAVDVDRCQVINQVGDEDTILPGRLLKCLKAALGVALSAPNHNNYLASEAIIRLFVELIGHYNQHIDTQLITFQKVNFVKNVHSESLRLFLEWFSETAMFSEFLEKRLHRNHKPGLFETRCSEILEKKAKMGTRKGLKFKHVKQFGDKLIDKMKLS